MQLGVGVLVAAIVALARAAHGAPVLLSGTLEPQRSETLRAPSAGTLSSAPGVEVGQPVRRGAVLARIADPTLDAAAADARAQIASAERASDMAQSSLAEIQAKAARRELLDSDVDRARGLADAARTAVADARARLAAVERAMAKFEIRAPFDGIVGERMEEPGANVRLDAAIFTVVDTSRMILSAFVAPDEVGAFKIGQALDVAVTGYAGAFRGVVTDIAPAVDPGTGQLQVTAQIANPARRLVGGLHAEARPAARHR